MENYEPVFESENIIYVKLSPLLVDDYLKMINDPSVASKLSHKEHHYNYDDELTWVNKSLESGSSIFSMLEKKTMDFIGNIEIDINNNIGEIGITITPEKQNKHYGYESLKSIIKYGYDVLNLDSIELNVFSTNLNAIKCYKNVGFVESGKGDDPDDIHMIYKR